MMLICINIVVNCANFKHLEHAKLVIILEINKRTVKIL